MDPWEWILGFWESNFGPLRVDFWPLRHLVVDVGLVGDNFELLEVDFSFGGEFSLLSFDFWLVGFDL